MLRKDYVVRQMEEFGKVLSLLLGFKREKDWEKFEKEIAAATQRFTPLEINTVENFTTDDFIKNVVDTNTISLEQKKILAGILYEKIEYYAQEQQHQKYKDCVAKCLMLYDFLHQNQTENEFNLETHYRLQLLKAL